jgi:hypothetical protein
LTGFQRRLDIGSPGEFLPAGNILVKMHIDDERN